MSNGNDHDELLDELRALAGKVDPVPDEVTTYAKGALGWRRVDAELAELLSDSAVDSDRLALTRGPGTPRALDFAADDLEIAIEIHDADPGVTILGQLAPPEAATVEVQRDDGTTAASTSADELGRFRLELDERGTVRLRIVREPKPVETSWFGL
jgi:uncharacterized protein (DUF1684 family)